MDKPILFYDVRVQTSRVTGGTLYLPAIVERLSPVELETVVENCIDRGLVAGLKPTAAHGIAEGVAAQIAREFSLGRGVQFGRYFYGRPYLSGTVDANGRHGLRGQGPDGDRGHGLRGAAAGRRIRRGEAHRLARAHLRAGHGERLAGAADQPRGQRVAAGVCLLSARAAAVSENRAAAAFAADTG